MKAGWILGGLVALALSGCAATGPTIEEIGAPPALWEEKTVDYVMQTFKDPSSIRDAAISEPVPASMVFDGLTPIPHSGWIVCFYANAKNSFGGYTGRQLSAFLFEGNQITVQLGNETVLQAQHHCAKAIYRPWGMTQKPQS